MRKILALLIVFTLLPGLFACGKPADPDIPFDLAAFAEDPLAFDLTDLAQFLTPPQLASLETALRGDLAAQGLEDYAALYFADPPEGCVKIPFGNETGADLSNINVGDLAAHITGQVMIAFEARGVSVGATVGRTTTTSKAATVATTTTAKATTTSTITTQKQATTSKTPATDYTPSQTLTIGGNLDRSRIVTLSQNNRNYYETEQTPTKVFRYDNSEGSWIIVQRPYADNYKQGGLVLDVYLSRSSNGTYDLVQTLRNSGETRSDDLFNTGLLLDSKAEKKVYEKLGNWEGYMIAVDIRFAMRNPDGHRDPHNPALPGLKLIDVGFSGGFSDGVLGRGGAVWQFNGSKFDKVDPN